jgi:DNA-directed RNA polymerase subunit RPC12/RpoP
VGHGVLRELNALYSETRRSFQIAKVNIDKLGKALTARGASVQCPACGSEDVRAAEDELMLFTAKRNLGRTVEGYSMYGVACTNCGHMRLFAKNVLG